MQDTLPLSGMQRHDHLVELGVRPAPLPDDLVGLAPSLHLPIRASEVERSETFNNHAIRITEADAFPQLHDHPRWGLAVGPEAISDRRG